MKKTVIILIAFVLLSYGCATSPIKEISGPEGGAARRSPVPQEEQETKSINVFRELLDLSASDADRDEVLLEMQKKYLEIINNYPDAPLAQESYYRLITILLTDYYPPEFVKAESHYNDFIKRYPGSKFKYLVDTTLGTSYLKSGQWEKLSVLARDAFNDYSKSGSAGSPTLLFMYAESNYKLNNLKEAEAGYNAVIRLFPDFGDGITSKARLEEIKSRNNRP
ncbi:MAG: tetratricopeptide repeat protein [Nitrospirae bacterium]|nr:tetratricopeptide repeat protein [Nitrospirota bacterium]